MFNYFEKKLYPYPDIEETVPPKGFLAFVWEATSGVRRYLVAMTLLTAAIGAFEALFFAILGRIVDWLSRIPPALLWEQERSTLLLFAGLLAASPLLVGLQNLFKHQV
jgi:ATP-binding cassette, subfamily B, multidrug efflux pump